MPSSITTTTPPEPSLSPAPLPCSPGCTRGRIAPWRWALAALPAAQEEHHAFAVFHDTHSTLGFAQNKYADIFLYQFERHLDRHIRAGTYNLEDAFLYDLPLFRKDTRIAFDSLEKNAGYQDTDQYSSSLFFSPFARLLEQASKSRRARGLNELYPQGLPDDTEQYTLSQVVDGALDLLHGLSEPAFAYLHFWTPHAPYAPEKPFSGCFSGGWQPQQKPIHRLSWDKFSFEELRAADQAYDEYIASWDAELGRLFDDLRSSGLMERSYIVITADHGELNERGDKGHFTPLIFDPLIHVPLIVSPPGQVGREDVHAFTSSVDVLPSLAHAVGKPIPAWPEGRLLPGLGGIEDPARGVYSMDAKQNSAFAALTKVTLSLTRGHNRLVYYHYPGVQQFEFYDLAADPDELTDLYPAQPSLALQMKEEMLAKLAEVNQR